MKRYRYKWKLKDRVIDGVKDLESEAALREHVVNLGGELVEIIETKDVPVEKKPAQSEEPSREAPVSQPAISTPASTDYNLLHKSNANNEPDIVLKIWGWLWIIGSIMGTLFTLIFGLSALFGGGEFTVNDIVLTSFWEKLGMIAVSAALCTIGFSLGFCILSFPVIAARLLFIFACLGILNNGFGVVAAPISSHLFWLAFNAFLIWHLVRKR